MTELIYSLTLCQCIIIVIIHIIGVMLSVVSYAKLNSLDPKSNWVQDEERKAAIAYSIFFCPFCLMINITLLLYRRIYK
jgi:hypothetical protein